MNVASGGDTAIYLNHANLICALGNDIDEVAGHLFDHANTHNFLGCTEPFSTARNLPVGAVSGDLLPVPIDEEDSRNNRLLTTVMKPLVAQIEILKQRYGADRIAVVLGTSTSGVADGETALAAFRKNGQLPDDYHYRKQEISAPSRYLAKWLGLQGPAFSVSSACTSGAKALACGARLLKLGVCDAVIAGAVDSLCGMTIEGFSSLSVTTDTYCNPFSANRAGINIGEGAAVFIMSREPAAVRLAGYGETSDAHHISSPHPEGLGAEAAMQQALQSAGLSAAQVDYVNFHGTGTDQNDRMEALAFSRLLDAQTACGSTKGLTGHTLAAAGTVEAVFCWLTLQREDGLLPVHRWDGQADPQLPPLSGLAATKISRPVRVALSNSFAFGGNNITLAMVACQ